MNSGAASLSSRHTLGRDSEQARFASFVHPADRDFCLFRDDGIAGHDKQTTETTDRQTDRQTDPTPPEHCRTFLKWENMRY